VTRSVLAIDQGTSGTTALVVDPDCGVLGAATVDVRPRYGPASAVEVDPQELFTSVVEAGRRALSEAGEPVAAVGLANQGETVLAWDPVSGIPFTDAVVWQDRRAQKICDELADGADRLRELTGLPLDPYFAAPKMAWLRRHRTRSGVVTTSDAWLVHQLTGAVVTDAATASRTMLLDLDTVDWSGEALEAFGLDGERLPEIVGSDHVVGTTDVFGPALPVTGLLVDQQAALLAQHCLEPGAAKCTYGTGAFVLANAGYRAVRSSTGLVGCVAWRLDGGTSYCLDGQVYTVGSAIRWLADLGVVSGAEDLDRLAGEAPDAGGVTFVPAFAGLAAPTWRGDARAQIGGLGLGATRAHVVRALVDGIAAQVVELTEAMVADLGTPIVALRVDGGLSRSRVLMQTQADLLQRPVVVYPSPEATALGIAAVARMGLEPGTTIAEATGPWHPAAFYEPRISADEAAHRLATHREAVRRLLGESDGSA
jgi:glycerol kinase